MADRFFIGPYSSGLVRDRKPFLLPDEAFSTIRNAYVFRDRVRKRFGARPMNGAVSKEVQQLFTRFRINIGTTDGAGNIVTTTPLDAGVPIATPAIGQNFSIGTEIFTVNVLGNPAVMLTTGASTVHTFDTTTGALTINGADANTAVYYYPALPVMGLLTRELTTVNDEQFIGFDTRFSYIFNGTAWEVITTAFHWNGSDSQFFWPANYRGSLPSDLIFFVTNFNAPDLMSYYDGTNWNVFNPIYNSLTGDTVTTARIIIPFQNRLVLLNTIEQVGGVDASFRNRARFSQNGNPLQLEAFYEPPTNFGRGDHIDAPTSEAIISAQILKDRLIVFFERSTWELAYTGNQVVPFVWQTINIELGVESTFSMVPFDKVLIGVGDVGIMACNAANVDRIDERIPDEVFQIHNTQEGPERVYGVRDYNTEMVYWAFPDDSSVATNKFPSRVLVYNYRNNSWAINDDGITAFGQYQFTSNITWENTDLSWDQADFEWNAGENQNKARNVIAGNAEGFTFIVDRDVSINSFALSITDMTEAGFIVELTIINHTLNYGSYIFIDNATSTNDPDGKITRLNESIFLIYPIDANTVAIEIPDTGAFNGAIYTGGGTVRRVSQIQLVTKQYNFYLDKGYSFAINKIDFLVDKVPSGEVSVLTYANSANFVIDDSVLSTDAYDQIYAPMEQQQEMVWHSIYPSGFGSFLQFQLTLTNEQMLNRLIADGDFVLNAMVIWADPTSYRLQ